MRTVAILAAILLVAGMAVQAHAEAARAPKSAVATSDAEEMFKRVAEYYTGMFRRKAHGERMLGSIGEDAGAQLSGSWGKRASGGKSSRQRTSRDAKDTFAQFTKLFGKAQGVSRFGGKASEAAVAKLLSSIAAAESSDAGVGGGAHGERMLSNDKGGDDTWNTQRSIGEDAGSQLSGSWGKRASGGKSRQARTSRDANAKAKFIQFTKLVKKATLSSRGAPAIDPEFAEAAIANFFAAESSDAGVGGLRGGARQRALWGGGSNVSNINFSEKRCCCKAGCPENSFVCIAACHAFGGACSMRGASVGDGADTAQRDSCRGASTSWTGSLSCPASCPAHSGA